MLPRMHFALLFSVVLVTGCSSGGRGFNPFSTANSLLESAKAIRDSNGGPLPLPRETEKQPLAAYTVEPGDTLLIQPVELDSPARIPADQPVLPDGAINLGKYGMMQVFGRTVVEIQDMVNTTVKTQTKGEVGFISVRLVGRQSKVIYVLGEVNAPGAFVLNGRETVLDALMLAGGITDRASADNIILSRPSHPADCRTVLPVCYRNIVQLGDTTTNWQLAPGDRIFVPGRGFKEMICPKKCEGPCCGPQFGCNGVAGCSPGNGVAPPEATHPPAVVAPAVARPRTTYSSLLPRLTYAR
ncbi:MAG: polysaccharide export protein [Gemmataceae bacterium]|nr:polysaccharide export protein [Gemmataceae bacterium]